MAKVENTKMLVSLDNDSKRLLRNLTRAIDRLARSKWDETDGASGVKRLSEPAEEPPTYATGGYTGDTPGKIIGGHQIEFAPEQMVQVAARVPGKYSALQ